MSTKKVSPVRLDDTHLRIIDDLRRVEPDIPTRSEMIRRVIERAGESLAPADLATGAKLQVKVGKRGSNHEK